MKFEKEPLTKQAAHDWQPEISRWRKNCEEIIDIHVLLNVIYNRYKIQLHSQRRANSG